MVTIMGCMTVVIVVIMTLFFSKHVEKYRHKETKNEREREEVFKKRTVVSEF